MPPNHAPRIFFRNLRQSRPDRLPAGRNLPNSCAMPRSEVVPDHGDSLTQGMEGALTSKWMEQGRIALTAVYLKSNHGYVGFIEELPGVNAHGRTIEEARDTLRQLAGVIFDEERRETEELIAGRDAVREPFMLPMTRRESAPVAQRRWPPPALVAPRRSQFSVPSCRSKGRILSAAVSGFRGPMCL